MLIFGAYLLLYGRDSLPLKQRSLELLDVYNCIYIYIIRTVHIFSGRYLVLDVGN